MAKKKDGYIKVKAEYELVYADKEPKASILTNTLEAPLQEVRVFNEDNECEDGWRNMLIFGDNLLALKTLYEDLKPGGPNKYDLRNKIKLIYIDPPFATKSDFMKDKEKAYSDKVAGSKFIEFLRKRIIFLREILADDGSIFVHLDWKKSHYIKAILDEVFGEVNFQNEIIFQNTPGHQLSSTLDNMIANIFYYKKDQKPTFKQPYQGLTQSELEAKFPLIEEGTGRRFNHQKLEKSSNAYSKGEVRKIYDREVTTEVGWIWTQKTFDERLAKNPNLIYWTETGRPRYKEYLDEYKGRKVGNLWNDLPLISSTSSESVNYPTQKPESLLDRIITMASSENDIVLDCFSGSGSTVAVAEKLKRKWIGIDCGKLSIYTIQNRLLNLKSGIGAEQKDKRLQVERIENTKETEKSRGMFFISEKAKKGQLDLTDDFLFKLHELLKNIKGMDEFSLVCPEEKFHLSNYEEDENGFRIIQKDQIKYKISFIEPKSKPPKSETLRAKSFVLYNAGVYDKENILNLHWEQYRDFVMKLFEVRKNEHSINGFKVDGYIGVHSAYIWNYPEKKKVAIDEEYVKNLHTYLKGKGGERFYVIAPGQSINFMQDEIKLGDTIYTFLKVPVSVLIRLIQSGELSSFKQPKSEENVNEVIDAFGFDFISQPQIEYTLHKQTKKEGLFNKEQYIIELSEFYSDGLLYSPEDFKNFETLSLVLIDLDYKEEPFTMDLYLWGKNLVKEETTPVKIAIDAEQWTKDKLAVILIDDYGNEKKLVFDKKDFK
jgi:DNA modification methylase